MPLFPIANLVVFQPWDWDNTKLLLYWFVAASILVAALLSAAWRAAGGRPGAAVVRGLVGVAVASLLLTGGLIHLNQIQGNDRWMLYSREDIEVAESIRATAPADALIAVGVYPNNAVLGLSGRQVLTAYPGWMWSHGFDSADREIDLRTIYRLDPEADALIAAYGIDYVVVGAWERENYAADPAAWRARFPVVIETANYLVLDVRS